MNTKDSLLLSWKNVKSNKLRTGITVIIMALGIFALILIITATTAASNGLTDSFSTMGANSFGIRYKDRNINFGGGNNDGSKKTKTGKKLRKSNTGIFIKYDEARLFKERFQFPGAKASIAIRGASGIIVNNAKKKSNPDVNLQGADENYLELNGYKIAYGRNFTIDEVSAGSNVCILGSSLAEKLFPDNTAAAVDAIVTADGRPYRVLAVLQDKGSSAFFNTGRVVIIPVNTVRKYYASGGYAIAVSVQDLKTMDVAIGEAIATFRPIRKIAVTDDNNFFIDKSDSIAASLLTNLSFLQIGTIGIAFITLIGAAIGLMNIMLVAVTERTKEIGLVKALGGTKKDIRAQFLFESVIISLLGAVVGIILGILLGNVVALILNTGFIVPWAWVTAAVIVCSGVGLLAGLLPAVKASRLDPIVALRYE